MKDKHGVEVDVGDLVRILEIDESFLKRLPDDERRMHEAMYLNEHEVDEIVEDGTKASVSFWREFPEGVYHGGLYMLSHEFELVKKSGARNDT